jgi:hypothetical protein
MNKWRPNKRHIETIVELTNARLPVALIATRVGTDEQTLLVWQGKIAAAEDPSESAEETQRIIASWLAKRDAACN